MAEKVRSGSKAATIEYSDTVTRWRRRQSIPFPTLFGKGWFKIGKRTRTPSSWMIGEVRESEAEIWGRPRLDELDQYEQRKAAKSLSLVDQNDLRLVGWVENGSLCRSGKRTGSSQAKEVAVVVSRAGELLLVGGALPLTRAGRPQRAFPTIYLLID